MNYSSTRSTVLRSMTMSVLFTVEFVNFLRDILQRRFLLLVLLITINSSSSWIFPQLTPFKHLISLIFAFLDYYYFWFRQNLSLLLLFSLKFNLYVSSEKTHLMKYNLQHHYHNLRLIRAKFKFFALSHLNITRFIYM